MISIRSSPSWRSGGLTALSDDQNPREMLAGGQSVERLLHHRHALVHHGADDACGTVGEEIGDPDYLGGPIRIGHDLRRSIVMREHAADRGPHHAARIVIDGHDDLAHRHSVEERDNTRAGLELRVGHESGYQAGMQRPDIAQRIPGVGGARPRCNLLAYGCHWPPPQSVRYFFSSALYSALPTRRCRSAKSTTSLPASPIRPSRRSTDSASCMPRTADCSATLA